MNSQAHRRRSPGLAVLLAATALAAAGCNRNQTAQAPSQALPLTTASAPDTLAPPLSALPVSDPAPVAPAARPDEGYAYLDRAYHQSAAYADAPPDYTVDYQGERPWIWRGADGSERISEATTAGLRHFYYEPGASAPYLVQDPDYSYAYRGGQLVAVYGRGGEMLPYEAVQRQADPAGRYLAWAAAVHAASLSQQHLAVERARWDARRADIAAERDRWQADESRNTDWAAYHQAHAAEEHARWSDEQGRRQDEAQHYAQDEPNRPRYEAPQGYQPPPPGDGERGGWNSPDHPQGGPPPDGWRQDHGGQDVVRQGDQPYGPPPQYDRGDHRDHGDHGDKGDHGDQGDQGDHGRRPGDGGHA